MKFSQKLAILSSLIFLSYLMTSHAEVRVLTKIKSFIFSNVYNKEYSSSSEDLFLMKPVNYSLTASLDSQVDYMTTKVESEKDLKDLALLSVKSGAMRVSTEPEPEINDLISNYEVKEGDTLESIAKIFGVSKNTIVWANSLKNKTIRPGDILLIFSATGVQYVATKDIKLSEVAKKYGADASEIAEFNGVSLSATFVKGDIVFIPDAEGEISSSVDIKRKVVTKPKIRYQNNAVAGYFMRPVSGCRLTQGLHGSYSTSVDFGCPVGTTVIASAPGKVIRAAGSGYNGGYGKVVIISHPNGTQSIYAHLSSISVSTGDTVTQGQVVGATGNTGRSTGPHLHFETRGTSNPFGN